MEGRLVDVGFGDVKMGVDNIAIGIGKEKGDEIKLRDHILVV
jgi:hypothetical protein